MNYACMLLLCMFNTCIGVVTDGELHVTRGLLLSLTSVLFGDFFNSGLFFIWFFFDNKW